MNKNKNIYIYNFLFIFVILFSLSIFVEFCFAKEKIDFSVDPEVILYNQSTTVRFTLKLPNSTNKPKITLIRIYKNAKEEKIKEMNDSGEYGDIQAKDRKFSTILKIQPKRNELFQFKCLIEYQTKSISSSKIQLEVIECPQ